MNHPNTFYRDAVIGLAVADALGVPVEFTSRSQRMRDPVTGIRSFGTYNQPAGTWSDDTSMTLCALDVLAKGSLDYSAVMDNFVLWAYKDAFNAGETTFDIGGTCSRAIASYRRTRDINTCGDRGTHSGNGSLMRIIPFCLWAARQQQDGMDDASAVSMIHRASALTHANALCRFSCGIYYFLVRSILRAAASPAEGPVPENLQEILQEGIDDAFDFYQIVYAAEGEAQAAEVLMTLPYFERLRDLDAFRDTPGGEIRSGGYVLASLEAAVWCLLGTPDYASCVLKAVNLGEDTDTTAAIAGGLAGLFYGYGAIPEEWRRVLRRRQWIEEMCAALDSRW